MYRAACVVTLIGVILLVVAIALPLVFPSIFDSKLNNKLVLKPDSEILKNFKETPIPIYFQIWIFNLTNAEQVYKGAKPVLQQLGPYTYRQQKQRTGLKWNHERGSVIFKELKYYYFEPHMSSGRESDLVTTINPVFISLASKVSGVQIEAIKAIAQLWFIRFSFKPFMTHSVGELLFSGYDEPLLGKLFQLTKDPAHAKGKFGYFYPRNGTLGPEVEIISGELGMDKYQHIIRWGDKEKLDFWSQEHCNLLNGTDGSQFPRPVTTSQPIRLFTAELCRSIYAVYEKDVKLGPLTLHRFVLSRDLLAASKENRCYCTSNFTCRSSMIDVSPCRKGSPVIISTPHFYQGNNEDLLNVEGLHPSKDEHQTHLDVEPNTGVTMRVSKRIQINMPLRRYASFPSLEAVPELVFPILWINESAEVPTDRAEKLYVTLTVPVMAVTYGSWGLLAIGLLLILVAAALAIITCKKNKELAKRRQQLSDKRVDNNSKKLLDEKSNA